MDLQLKGKKAVVTGASRGICCSIAELLADEGCDVAVCARGQDGVDAAVKALEAKGVKAWGRAVDIAAGPAITGFVEDAAQALGGLDILVSNASALVNGGSEADWRSMFEIDMLGAVRTYQAAKPHLEKAAAAGGDARRMLMARFVLEHRLSDRPKLAADGGDWEEAAISALLDESPVSLDRASSMLTA